MNYPATLSKKNKKYEFDCYQFEIEFDNIFIVI